MADKMHIYEDLKEMVEEEIDKIVKKDELDEKCLMYLDKLVDISKDIETIEAMRSEYSYGNDNGYSIRMYPQNSYDDWNSYQRRNSMGRYSREGNYYNGGGSMRGGNSYDDMSMRNSYNSNGETMSKLENMLATAKTDREREAIRMAMQHI